MGKQLTKNDDSLQAGLTPEQELAVFALASGASDTQAASQAGVSRQALWQWRQKPEFQVALNGVRQAQREQWQAQAEALSERALAIMARALDSEDDAMRYKAASFVLEKSGLLAGSLPKIGPTSASMIALTQWGF